MRVLVCAMLQLPVEPQPSGAIAIRQADQHRSIRDRPPIAVSADGRYVAFTSFSRLVPDDTNDSRDIYVLDRTTQRVTLESGVVEGVLEYDSDAPDLSGDGRFLVYQTQLRLPRLEPSNIVLRDRHTGASTVLSRTSDGKPADGPSSTPAISADGRTVVFTSAATNLDNTTDPSGVFNDVFAADVLSPKIRRVSTASGFSPAVSADGRYIAFVSSSGRPPMSYVYVHDSHLGITIRVSVGKDGRPANGGSSAPAISGDGNYVAFASVASNLVSGDDNRASYIFSLSPTGGCSRWRW